MIKVPIPLGGCGFRARSGRSLGFLMLGALDFRAQVGRPVPVLIARPRVGRFKSLVFRV